ncbi:MAG TPA: DUF2911 domain-containing protein [Chitinophagaceae bacterium]|nr:DUF2911 domain-containing protein [Chitinophagaceae bacterium]
MMRSIRLLAIVVCLAAGFTTQAQSKFPAVDKSPMDASYYPVNYPILKIQDKATDPLLARVIYSRPQKSGRVVFGELVEFGKVWRMGANEATELEFYKDVKIGAKKIKKGRYTVYALVNPTTWSIILNSETDIWGAFKYDPKKDVIRFDVPVQKNTEQVEAMAINFEKQGNGFNMVVAWDEALVKLPINQ